MFLFLPVTLFFLGECKEIFTHSDSETHGGSMGLVPVLYPIKSMLNDAKPVHIKCTLSKARN